MRRQLLRTVILTLSLAALAAAWPSAASAQGRRGRVATRVVVTSPYVYRPYWSGAYFNPYWDPWFGPGWGWGGWGWGSPYPYNYRLGPAEASVRLDVKPRDAQVYVDGYYAGIVDEFDGKLQRLHVRPGQHEITIYKEGFRSARDRVYLSANSTRKITHDLVPLASGDANEPLPTPDPNAAPPDDERGGRVGPPPGADRFPPRRERGRRQARGTSMGSVAIRVQPVDAEIRIDGEPWTGNSDDERLVVQLSEGPHRIEVDKPGYRPAAIDVDVRPGDTTPVNISLSRE